MKRGQITAYIAVAFVILIFALAFFTIVPTQQITQQDVTPQISSFTRNCIKQVGEAGVELVGLQGGYAFPSEVPGYIGFGSFAVEYAFYEGENLLPQRPFVERQLSLYMDEFLDVCLQDYDSLRELIPGEVVVGEIDTEVTVGDRNVGFVVHQPVSVRFEDEVVRVEEFIEHVDVPLGELMNHAQDVMDMLSETPGMVDVIYLARMPVDAEYMPISPKEGVMTLMSDIELRNRPYAFMFGVWYGNNTPPVISSLPPVRVRAGQYVDVFAQAIDLEGQDISWFDDAPDWDIDPNSGHIRFQPQTSGTYHYTIFATDGELVDEETLEVIVR